jgi:Domain of unknown function (DUF1735)
MRNKIFMIVTLLAVVFSLNSCLKDDVGIDWTSSLKGKMYAEVWNPLQLYGLQPVPDTVTLKFLVNIASDQPPTQDITVTLGVDTSLIGKYNTRNKANYLLYPNIQVIDNSITIKAGTQNAYVHVKVWSADKLDACNKYMAPISILTATGGVIVADPLNVGACLLALSTTNPYVADYHCVGYRLHPSLGVLAVDKTETLSQVDCHTVVKSGFGDYPYNVQITLTSNTIDVLGTTCLKVNLAIIDPATGSPVSSGTGQYDTFTGSATSVPIPLTNDVNYYNPVTRTFVINGYYNSGAPRIMYEVLTRL